MIALRASAPLDSSSDTERKSDFLLFFLSILCVMVGFRLCFFFVSLFRLTTICRGAIIGTPNIRCWCEIKTQRYTKVHKGTLGNLVWSRIFACYTKTHTNIMELKFFFPDSGQSK